MGGCTLGVHFISGGIPGVGGFGRSHRTGRQWVQATSCWAGECSKEDRCKPPRPATPCNPSTSRASGRAHSAKLGQPGSEKEGAKGQKPAPPAGVRARKLNARGPPLRMGAAPAGCTQLPRRRVNPAPEPLSAREAAERKGHLARGRSPQRGVYVGGRGPSHPGRPPPPPPPRPPPRRSIPRRGPVAAALE